MRVKLKNLVGSGYMSAGSTIYAEPTRHSHLMTNIDSFQGEKRENTVILDKESGDYVP